MDVFARPEPSTLFKFNFCVVCVFSFVEMRVLTRFVSSSSVFRVSNIPATKFPSRQIHFETRVSISRQTEVEPKVFSYAKALIPLSRRKQDVFECPAQVTRQSIYNTEGRGLLATRSLSFLPLLNFPATTNRCKPVQIASSPIKQVAPLFTANMSFTLPPLPYDYNALEPYISAETLHYHHDKHHASYVKKLNELTQGTDLQNKKLEDVVMLSTGPILNNAGQIWNHNFYFDCMKSPNEGGGGEPSGALRDHLLKKWGTYDKFKEEFSKVAVGHFGSGWAWLSWCKEKKELKVEQTHDASSPMKEKTGVPLLCCDVWEHAYYIDRRNDRSAYVDAWWKVVNWKFAEKNFESLFTA